MKQQVERSLPRAIVRTVKAPHRLIIGLGLLLLPYCLSSRFVTVADSVVKGSPSVMLMAVALALYSLWSQRRHLAALQSSAEDRLLGSLLILSAASILPLCQSSIWAQNALGLVILFGVACS
jgi:hypothetical protein